ncbi:AIPR family protein [Cupriavidus sp. SK-4]|uniref:AIPR family protein n=1 Tax=Cupriavidus sp. SK-4 TaxID=574750 RepID=UPI0009FBFAE0|nr:AIPR family protein [Cupriavidus sp. SK-4]
MAKNDTLLLDGIIDDKVRESGLPRDEAFENFAFEQVLKSFDPTQEEIEFGWVDGGNDGGIDGFYTFINGVLLQEPKTYNWPRKGGALDIWIISCKHHDTFKQDTLNNIFPTIEELLDFRKSAQDFNGEYSGAVLKAREITVQAYRKTAGSAPSICFHFVYASRGDKSELGANIEARGNQIKRFVGEYFSNAEVELEFLGATELVEKFRKNRVILELPYAERLSGAQGAEVLLVPIDAYAKFVSDEHGNLRRYLFDSNVRDFLGENRVNEDIARSLQEVDSPDFWWLNNGVTILATSAYNLGKTLFGYSIELHDVQIVNGLQTTQSIFNYFKSQSASTKERCVLVKIVVSEDDAIRDKIIQATNNQSPVEIAALNATDKIQRDIEAILERHDWYYERRKNYYKNIGRPATRFVLPIQLAVGVVAIYRKAPAKASSLKTRFMRNPASYSSVFSDKFPLELWPKIAEIMKAVEHGLAICVSHSKNGHGSRMIGAWRGPVALCVMAKLNGTFNLSISMIMAADGQQIFDRVEEVFSELQAIKGNRQLEKAKGRPLEGRDGQGFNSLCQQFAVRHGLAGEAVIGKWVLPTADPSDSLALKRAERPIRKQTEKLPSPAEGGFVIKPRREIEVSEELLTQFDELLPPQPWPPGTAKMVREKLDLSQKVAMKCITKLIVMGKRHNQYHGVVVNRDGIIVAVDKSRADSKYIVGEQYREFANK